MHRLIEHHLIANFPPLGLDCLQNIKRLSHVKTGLGLRSLRKIVIRNYIQVQFLKHQNDIAELVNSLEPDKGPHLDLLCLPSFAFWI